MGKMKKIQEQDDVVYENRSQIVSASAGSGKTTVMIRKVVEHIKDKDCHVDEVLILTYTTASALEMKKKLVERLKKESVNNEFLQDELDVVQTADICTIDSFCQKLVKKYFYILNIDPSFGILEAGDQVVLQGRALDFAIDKLKEKCPEDYENLITNLSASRSEQKIKDLILEIYNYLTAVFDEKSFWSQTLDLYDKNKKIAENELNNHYTEKLVNIKNEFDNLLIQAKRLNFVKYVEYINGVNSAVDSLILEKDFGKFVCYCSQISFATLKAISEDEIDFKSKIVYVRDKFKKIFAQIKTEYIDEKNISNSYDNCKSLILALKNLYDFFVEFYKKEKSKNNTFDFDDIERLAIKLLEDDRANAEIKNSYKKIFVDEFQDANRVQEKIIFLIENNNLFFVGDTKQSIYGFRQSEPDIFLDIEKRFENSTTACAKKLNCNFRTNKNILEFANFVFSEIMTIESCDIDYQNKAQFEPMADFEDLPNENCVSLDILLKRQDGNEKTKITNVYSVKQNACSNEILGDNDYESAYICQKITELLGQDIFDKDSEKVRKINFNDIAILVNKRGAFLQTLLKHLKKTNIPYVVNVNQNLEECYDNQVLFSLMKLTQNFQDDYALYSVLSSYLFDFCDMDLGVIKGEFLDEKFFYNCLLKYANLDNALAKKITEFIEKLQQFTFDVKYKGIYFALDKIIKDSNYLIKINNDEDYQERRLNINAFVNSFANSEYNFNLSEYILYRETTVRQEKVQTDKSFSKAIEITTMHSSKGLEYPVVILPFLSQDFLKSPVLSDIKINKYLGVGIKDFNEDERSVRNGIFYNACKIKNTKQEISEKIRLLYVAMTRAKNKLIMVGTLSGEVEKIGKNIFEKNNFLSLIAGSLPSKLIEKINQKEEFSCPVWDNEKNILSCIKIGDIVAQNQPKDLIAKKSSLQEVEYLKNYLQKDIKQKASHIALKNSVSQFAFDDNASFVLAPKTFDISEHTPNNLSDVGTLYHKVLQVCDFDNIEIISDVQAFVECNFCDEDVEILKKIGYENIFDNIVKVKNLIAGFSNILKEQKFVMRAKHSDVVENGEDCYILIQGMVDLMAVGEKDVLLIDYKYTKKDNNTIINTYKKQIDLYEMALSKRFKGKNIHKIIINLRKNSLINM